MSQRSSFLYDQFYIDKGEGEPILLLHGLFGNLDHWKGVVDYFSLDHRVVIPRLPIFELQQQHIHLEKLSILFDEFLDFHQLTDVTLVGNSMGGHLALLYALLKPENVKRLVLTGSSGLFETSIGGMFPYAKEHDLIAEKVTYADKALVIKETVNPVIQNLSQKSQLDALPDLPQQNKLSRSLHKIDHPTLLIWGLQDQISPPEVALHFHDLLPNSEIKFIDHCGHLPMKACPDAFNKYVNDFLKKY